MPFPRPLSAVLLAASLLLAGCSFSPYGTTPPKALAEEIEQIYLDQKLKEGPRSTLTRPAIVSICWGPALNNLPELYDTVLLNCPGDYQRIVYYGRDALATTCAFAQPYRHTFLCYDAQQRTILPPIPGEGRVILPQQSTRP